MQETFMDDLYARVLQFGFYEIMVTLEEDFLKRALTEAHQNKTRAAQKLRLNRTTLVEKLKKLGISQ